jgi:hypothetical protein
MKKKLLNELSEMKYLFGYERGRVISEQKSMIEDFMDSDPDVAEPETKPKTRPGTKPDTDREERPFTPGRPDRDPRHIPYEDPDTHPQGFEDDEIEYELELSDEPDVAEPEVKPDIDRDRRRRDREERPFSPGRPNRDPDFIPYENPETHPQGRRRGSDDLEDFVMKYLKNRR